MTQSSDIFFKWTLLCAGGGGSWGKDLCFCWTQKWGEVWLFRPPQLFTSQESDIHCLNHAMVKKILTGRRTEYIMEKVFLKPVSLNLLSKSYRERKEFRGIRSIHWILFSGNFSGLFNCYFFMLLACCNSIDAVLTCSHNDVLDNKHHSAMMQLQAQAEEVLPYFRLTFSLLTTTGLCNWSEALKLLNLPLVDSLLLSYFTLHLHLVI